MRVLLTGCTGFVGSELTRTLLLSPDVERVQLLIRPQAGLGAEGRFVKMREHWARFLPVPDVRDLKKARVIEHDLSSWLPPSHIEPADCVIHLAASTELGEPLGASRRANLYMTQRALALAERTPGLQRFVHLSTAYVAGRRRGVIHESDASLDNFHNHYERSKYESELCVRSFGLPYVILRPSIIVGRSDNGYAARMKVLYSVWRAWLSGVIPRAPMSLKAWVDIVPVDYVVDGIKALALSPEALGKTLHLCAGDDRQRSGTIMHCAIRNFDVPAPPLAPPWMVRVLRTKAVSRFLNPDLNSLLQLMYHHVPYLGMPDRLFSMTETSRLLAPLGVRCPTFAEYGDVLFRYCKETAWGKKPLVRSKEAPCSASA